MAGTAVKRHAQAAFQIALERGELDAWRKDLDRLRAAVKVSLLFAFLESPRVHFDEKAGVLSRVLEGLDPLVMNLALLLVSRGRLRLLAGIVEEYGRLVDENQGLAHASVTTAVPLEADERRKVIVRLRELIGREIVISDIVEPSILGGLTIRVGDKLIDGSTKSKFFALRESLKR
jgi:F-type H+-transporting ATPase subunit delta